MHFLLPSNHFCQQISAIIILTYMPCQWLFYCHRLVNGMISNCITLLLKYWLWNWGVWKTDIIIYVSSDIGMSTIFNLYQMAFNVCTPMFIVTNSILNTDVSMVDCFFEYQLVKDMLINIMNPVIEPPVCLLLTWLLPKIISRFTSLPLGNRTLGGIGSTAPS